MQTQDSSMPASRSPSPAPDPRATAFMGLMPIEDARREVERLRWMGELATRHRAKLVRVARADHFGRTTPEALARRFPAGETFLQTARELTVEHSGPVDVVLGRHLIARGLTPGPHFARLLERSREIQDETGWQDPQRILDAVLNEGHHDA